MEYTCEQINELIILGKNAELQAPEEFAKVPLKELVSIFNGVGPASLPGWLSERTTWVFRSAQATALIHDYMYSKSDGSEEARKIADKFFLLNGI